MIGYVFPLTLNGIPRQPFDVGGREPQTLTAKVWEGLVRELSHRADLDGIGRNLAATVTGRLEAWLTEAGPLYELHVSSPFGFTAVLGPLPLNREVFESAGGASHFDGANNDMRFAFHHRSKLVRGESHVSHGPGPVMPAAEPGRVAVYTERIDSGLGVSDATFNAEIRPDEAGVAFEQLCAAIAYGTHGPRGDASGFTRTIDHALVTLAVHDARRTQHRFTVPPELRAAAAACPRSETITGLRVTA